MLRTLRVVTHNRIEICEERSDDDTVACSLVNTVELCRSELAWSGDIVSSRVCILQPTLSPNKASSVTV